MFHSYFLENGKIVTKPGYFEACQWLNIEGVGESEISLLKKLGFHELAIEDVLRKEKRMRVEKYNDYLFLAASTIENGTSPLYFSIFLSKSRIITIASRKLLGDNEVIKRCERNPNLFARGHDFILYSFLDYLASEYFPLLSDLDDELVLVEKKILTQPTKDTVFKLLRTKRRLLVFKKSLVALRDLVLSLRQFEGEFINTKNMPYFQDVLGHLIRLNEQTDLLRDMVSTAFEEYLSVLSNNLNEIMKRLTALTVILMVPTLIAGIYGMNFKFIPVSTNPLGFYTIFAFMVFLTVALIYYFRKKKWF